MNLASTAKQNTSDVSETPGLQTTPESTCCALGFFFFLSFWGVGVYYNMQQREAMRG